MVFGHIISSPRGNLSLQKSLELANAYLDNANKTQDTELALVFCHDTEVSLSQARKLAKRSKNQGMHREIATAYAELGRVLSVKGFGNEAQAIYQKAEKWEGPIQDQSHSPQTSESRSIEALVNATATTVGAMTTATRTPASVGVVTTMNGSLPPPTMPKPPTGKRKLGRNTIATISKHIFADKVPPPNVVSKLPQPDERLIGTTQLACCLSLLRASYSLNEVLEPVARDWLQAIAKDEDEDERLKMLALDVIRAYKRDELKDAKVVAEVVCLSPVLDKEVFRDLLSDFYSGIDQSGMLKFQLLDGLAQMVQGADPGYLDADDLVKILQLLSDRLRDTHGQSRNHIYQLTLAASRVLDAMADTKVTGLDREALHLPLTNYLNSLKKDADPCMVYQAAYAYQALLCVPDDESLWQATIRRTGKIIKGVSGLVSAVKGLDLNGFIEGLGNIQQGLEGVTAVYDVVKTVYGVTEVVKSGKTFIECLKEGLSFRQKCAWYTALRGADELIQQGEFVAFKKLVCEAPCRLDLPFQWGICQRLGEIAANPAWDVYTRRNAVSFLGEIYVKDEDWGHQESVKQWIIDILLMLSSSPENGLPFAETLLHELEKDAPLEIKAYIETYKGIDPGSHPFKIASPPSEASVLLDRVQNKPDVEGTLRQIKRYRQKERGVSVFIQPQAKASLKASDDDRFDLMDNVKEFIVSDQKVFLLLGDSGSGKSTFNLQLECDMWDDYKKGTGVIPLHINLPAIEKPEQDIIAKQLRKLEFTEPEIRELKNRNFLLICDGYDESQQTHNLYMSNRLNQTGEWKAQMVITCRSEYVGVDYKDRFQPGGRNNRTNLGQFQEAVMTPFTAEQIGRYVDEYVKVHQPLWEAKEYKDVLSSMPSLMELVKNPFLMTLSLEVLPRIVDPKNNQLSTTQVTRVALYDQFIVHWLERGKKRLSEEELSSQAKAAFQSLVDEGFTQNGVDFLKKLAVAIFKKQGGQPVVKYSRFKDEGTWKSEFFSREDEKQLLREACPLTRSGNQHRFVHRSLLEYGLALAIFDPQDWKDRNMPEPGSVAGRRGSVSSAYSFHVHGSTDAEEVVEETINDGPDPNSPLVWRYYVNEPSVVHFLAERVQQEPLFKEQLLKYIEWSKDDEDKKWRVAAANAITILVKAGVRFNGADLRGVQIPGADLSHGEFDSAQLQGADLRQAKLRNAWLCRADLSEARMMGVQFGELPRLQLLDKILSCAYAPDSMSLAVGYQNSTIEAYTASNLDLIWRVQFVMLLPRTHRVNGLAYSADSAQLAAGCEDWTVRILDARTGEITHNLFGHEYACYGVAFSPLGDLIASASLDETVRIWDSGTGECRQVLSGHTRDVRSVAFSPSGDQLASSSRDATVRLWDVATGDCQVLEDHTEMVVCIAYSPQGHLLASASFDKTVRLWDLETLTCSRILTGHRSEVWGVAFSGRGDIIASASEDRTIRLWDIETGVCRQMFTGHTNTIYGVIFPSKGGHLASWSYDNTVRFWDIGAEASGQATDNRNAIVRTVKFFPQRDQIACHRSEGPVQLFDAETGLRRTMARNSDLRADNVVYSPELDKAAAKFETTVQLWDVATGECHVIHNGHMGYIIEVRYSPLGNQVATASADMTIKLWDPDTGKCVHTLTGHTDAITAIAYSPDGSQIASGGLDSTLRLWNVKSGQCSHVVIRHTDCVNTVAYSPNGEQVASGSSDTTIKLHSSETGACIHTLTGHEGGIERVEYAPGGDVIVSTATDKRMRIWDTRTGDCRHICVGHTSTLTSLLVTPNGSMVVTGSADKTVRLWDMASGRCRAVIQDFNSEIHGLDWRSTLDGKYLITGSEDGSVRMWSVVEEGGDSCRIQLCWSSVIPTLAVSEASIQGVLGLSPGNSKLLKQRGVVGTPISALHEASKKISKLASVISALRSSSSGELQESPNRLVNQPGQQDI